MALETEVLRGGCAASIMPAMTRTCAISLALTLLNLAIFWPTLGYPFINMDDNIYVTENEYVIEGVSWRGLKTALVSTEIGHWHPLTWLSHMADVEFYGFNAGGHHATSVLLHMLNTLLLFLLLKAITGAERESAVAAALFAVHPLHVEPVVWVSSRKDVLSTFCFLLALHAYAHYARKPNVPRYLTVFLLFILGLAAKSMIIVFPFVLFLLDYWPLRRLHFEPGGTWRRRAAGLVLEKAPMLAVTVAVSILTMLAARTGEVLTSWESLPLGARIENAFVSYALYIWQAIIPMRLGNFYPHPGPNVAAWQWSGAALLLLAVTVVAVIYGRRCPYLPVGWLWFLGTLVPVIGIFHFGAHLRADRYTYLSMNGLLIMAVWGVSDLAQRLRWKKWTVAAVPAAALAGLLCVSLVQVRYWRDQSVLYEHTLAVTRDNAVVHNHLGLARAAEGRLDDAIAHWRASIRARPAYVDPYVNLGGLQSLMGRFDEAEATYAAALPMATASPELRTNMGNLYARTGRFDEAVPHYEAALEADPDNLLAHYNLGNALSSQGDVSGARAAYEAALRIDPNFEPAKKALAMHRSRDGY